MKKRSVLAALTLATGAVIAAISPPPGGGDTAHAAEPPVSLGALDNVGELGTLVDGAAGATTSTAGTVTSAPGPRCGQPGRVRHRDDDLQVALQLRLGAAR
ncbi:hypothetical protein ACWCQI_24085, partial [Streptomyces griseus]